MNPNTNSTDNDTAHHHDDARATSAMEVAPRRGVAFVIFTVGALITAGMAAWFALYVFQALNGDLTFTDQTRGHGAADEARGSEPGSFWFLVALWTAAFVFSARASLRCARLALELHKALDWRRLLSRA